MQYKIDNIKQNLKNEIKLIEKIFSNYNQYFLDYFYFLSFHHFYDNIENINNKHLRKFKDSINFEEQTKILMNYIISNNNEIKYKNVLIKKLIDFGGIISKINDKYFFSYSYLSNIAEIDKYHKDKNEIYYLPKSKISFPDKIYSVSCSNKSNKIYACLNHRKAVAIFQYNLIKKTMNLCEEEIRGLTYNPHFNKCIELVDDYVATSEMDEINIWFKFQDDNKFYSNVRRLLFAPKINDILLINNNYFISSHYESEIIVFYDINDSYKESIITDIKPYNYSNCLYLFNEYIIVNCINGISLISINTRQLVQFIEYSKPYDDINQIFIGNDDNIYISDFSSETFLVKYEFRDGYFVIKEKYKSIETDKKRAYFLANSSLFKMMCINDEDIIIWGKNMWILEETMNDSNKLTDNENEDELEEEKEEEESQMSESEINEISEEDSEEGSED